MRNRPARDAAWRRRTALLTHAIIYALTVEKRELEGRRKPLELPVINREILSGLVSNFKGVMAEGTNSQENTCPAAW